MRFRRDLTEWAARKARSGTANWLTLPELGEELTFSFPLQAPSERDVETDREVVVAWLGDWARFVESPGVVVRRVERRWPSFGRQTLPTHVTMQGASALARVAGQGAAWQRLRARGLRLRTELGDHVAPALRTISSRLAELPESDVDRLIATVAWLLDHPDSGLLARQLPVVGVDSKWLERHRGLANPLVKQLAGRSDLGLARDPRRFRLRVLDDRLIRPPMLADFSASADELRRLDVEPRWVLITENLASMIGLGPLPGTIAVHGLGVDVVELAAVPWIASSRVCYWGDLDSHGFRILGLARKTWPQTESILMDTATFDQFSNLAEPEPAPYRGQIGYLTGPEQATLSRLRQHDSRLEQERIEWGYAWSRIREKLED